MKNNLIKKYTTTYKGYENVKVYVEEGETNTLSRHEIGKLEKYGTFKNDSRKIVITNDNYKKYKKDEKENETIRLQNTIKQLEKEIKEEREDNKNLRQKLDKIEQERKEKEIKERNKKEIEEINKIFNNPKKIEFDEREISPQDMSYDTCRRIGISKEIAEKYYFEKWSWKYEDREELIVEAGGNYYIINPTK